MIIDMKPLSMAEADELIGDSDREKDISGFIKKFSKIKEKEALELREKINELNLAKIKDEHIAKIIDLLPEDAADINKIFIDISLEEDEVNKILSIVKEFK